MNEIEYRKFYENVGNLNGWDFSQLQVVVDEPKWDFYDEVKKRSRKTTVLLDIGTGGGENVLTVSSSFLLIVGIDLSHGMIKTAKENIEMSNIPNVRFFQMSSESLQFPSGFFDMVSSRHAPFVASEVADALKTGGLFLTQQVSEADKLNIKNAFERGQSFGEVDGTLRENYVQELKEAGFSNVQVYEYNIKEYYQRPEDLIFLLQHTPIIPNFGREPEDFSRLNAFIKSSQTDKGICTNSKRFLIAAQK
ncbi:class I SAM-dependent methyltransferase [Planococcus halocryophilus]|uniref:class I SAM-dependent methyltransferase n=1 Tax=Planococcus halocryophilus TaxID=1215089 RepID=UPI001F0FB68C|nr:class I SAM-dependent methyltransferase [Planococcus halocryophilus]MCH4827582.1 class I SAM-dependent methyltransferase [Planococcus halocryophilus]